MTELTKLRALCLSVDFKLSESGIVATTEGEVRLHASIAELVSFVSEEHLSLESVEKELLVPFFESIVRNTKNSAFSGLLGRIASKGGLGLSGSVGGQSPESQSLRTSTLFEKPLLSLAAPTVTKPPAESHLFNNKNHNILVSLSKKAKIEASRGAFGLRRSPCRNRPADDDEEQIRASNSQSQVSFGPPKRHQRILKQVRQTRNQRQGAAASNCLIVDPRKSSASLSRLLETFSELSPKRLDPETCGQRSMTFCSTEESTVKGEAAPVSSEAVAAFDPFSQELVLGKTPVSACLSLEEEMPLLQLE